MISRENPLRQMPYFELLMVLSALFVSMLVSGLVIQSLGPALGITDVQETIKGFTDETSKDTISAIKILHLASHLFLFILTPFIFLGIINHQRPFKYLMLHRAPGFRNIFLGIALMLSAFPLVFFVYWINNQIPLPDSLVQAESQAMQMVKYFVAADSPGVLMFNIFSIAMIPAIGEELLFRGVLQRIFGKISGSPHVAIWITAIVFSAFHMQFAGFFSRLLLGAVLGYLLYWSASLWVPIIAHFFYNGIQVVGAYIREQQGLPINTGSVEYFPGWITLISFILVVGLCYLMHKTTFANQQEYEAQMKAEQ